MINITIEYPLKSPSIVKKENPKINSFSKKDQNITVIEGITTNNPTNIKTKVITVFLDKLNNLFIKGDNKINTEYKLM
jgi:hypothetical protein